MDYDNYGNYENGKTSIGLGFERHEREQKRLFSKERGDW